MAHGFKDWKLNFDTLLPEKQSRALDPPAFDERIAKEPVRTLAGQGVPIWL